ncbi:SCO2525 family SAM-dependent methyltransferase [Cryptosporangium phraense]|uniref:Methyltransferase n=1 Tax=Cryptosporangium phraense TaxID=2593070 RepID=A0A545AW42_9ACTN|nr:SCO2525 family SAM-dependent methyltransferase [Cryptosporangium phraense]TQS45537.1 methyltransferase [Cryptosporangium phraense]
MTTKPKGNRAFDWAHFNAKRYADTNYAKLRPDDQYFLGLMRDHFVACAPAPDSIGVDLGAGPNLYPAFAMLPHVGRLILLDFSVSNVRWLREQVHGAAGYARYWDPFWRELSTVEPYRSVRNPRADLSSKTSVERRDLFRLVSDPTYDIGTMFFVAESLTDKKDEFEKAVAKFFAILKRGAPFASAFMVESDGYNVDGASYPAVSVEQEKIKESLGSLADELKTWYVPASDAPLRHGYAGMLLAVGRKRG